MRTGLGFGLPYLRNSTAWFQPDDLFRFQPRKNRVMFNAGGTRTIMTVAQAISNSRLTFTRSSLGWAFDAQGNLVEFASAVPRVTNAGLLLEPSRTNGVRNSIGSGNNPVTNTQPTYWGGWVNASVGCEFSIVGAGVENGMEYIETRMVGTADTSTGIRNGFEQNGVIAAATGNVFTHSVGWKLVANPGVNLPSIQLEVRYFVGGTGSDLTGTVHVPDGTIRRISHSATAISAGITHVSPTIRFGVTSGVSYDFTLRFYLPQCELGAYATSPIKTTSAAVTRAAETFIFTGINANWAPAVTLCSEHILYAYESGNQVFTAPSLDGSNRIDMAGNATSGGRIFRSVVAGASQISSPPGGNVALNTPERLVGRLNPAGASSRAAVNNTLAATSTNATALPAVTSLRHGSTSGATNAPMLIRESFISSKLFSDAELQAESLRYTS